MKKLQGTPRETAAWDLAQGQNPQRFTATRRTGSEFLLYLPASYGSKRGRWPLMMFLHGSGEGGNDLRKIRKYGPPKLIDGGKEFPFIVVSPQCPEDQLWSVETLQCLLDELVARLRVDENRIYLTGLSLGGFGAWSFALTHPERFAAIAPVCGWGWLYGLSRLREMPVWVFHGAKDDVVLPGESVRMVDELKRIGNTQVKFTLYPDASHNCWDATYANPDLYSWFLKHSRK